VFSKVCENHGNSFSGVFYMKTLIFSHNDNSPTKFIHQNREVTSADIKLLGRLSVREDGALICDLETPIKGSFLFSLKRTHFPGR